MLIYKPSSGHRNTAFRAIVDIWQFRGYCDVEITNEKQVWVGGVGEVLLYDLDHWRYLPKSWKLGLFANVQHSHGLPWTYFARSPKTVERLRNQNVQGFDGRSIGVFFCGSVENYRQLYWRGLKRWSKVLDQFLMPIYHKRGLYDKVAYLEQVKAARYGLCLRGNGPKCSREIELMAFGTVPIFGPGVGTEYFNKLIEGVHYIRAESPAVLRDRVAAIGPGEWAAMSAAGRQWYEENASPDGCFRLTQKILEDYAGSGVAGVENSQTLGWLLASYADRPLYAIDRVLGGIRKIV